MSSTRNLKVARIVGVAAAATGLVSIVLAPFVGDTAFDRLWGVEPLSYIGAVVLLVGMAALTLSYILAERSDKRVVGGGNDDDGGRWSEITQQYFDLFNHDLGRPLTLILARERELRTALGGSSDDLYSELMDEIERQVPNFRLMLANMQVLVTLEAPEQLAELQAVEPSEVIRRIVDRYSAVASEADKEITWWSEPEEFGIVYSDNSAIEHITTNLVDNAVRYGEGHIEVRLTRNPTHFFIRVWDDGPGISAQYLPHLFDRGWTPEVARRDEKSSSGLGLHIARTLATRYGGDLTVESVTGPQADHHTAFLASLGLGQLEVTQE